MSYSHHFILMHVTSEVLLVLDHRKLHTLASFMKHEQNEFLCKSFVKPFLRKLSHSIQCNNLHKIGFMTNLHRN